jgi:hypothetical protein
MANRQPAVKPSFRPKTEGRRRKKKEGEEEEEV